MRLLFELDRKDYGRCTRTYWRNLKATKINEKRNNMLFVVG